MFGVGVNTNENVLHEQSRNDRYLTVLLITKNKFLVFFTDKINHTPLTVNEIFIGFNFGREKPCLQKIKRNVK